MTLSLLGVRLDNLTQSAALIQAADFLQGKEQRTVFTPNPEMLVKADGDPYFKKVLNSSNLNICDGFGLRLLSGFSLQRLTGVDFMLALCRLAEEKGKLIYLIGSGRDDVVKKTAERLQKKFPKLKIAGYDKGPVINEKLQFDGSASTIGQYNNSGLEINLNDNTMLIEKIKSAVPDILFVAFGMGKQEKWIYENASHLTSVKIAVGVGGAFDYISGNVPRAPLLLRKIGLEWAYRLVKQPQRLKRIWRAAVVFPFLIFKTRLTRTGHVER